MTWPGPGRPAKALIMGVFGVFLSSCAEGPSGVFAPVEGFAGVVAGDEPRAVVVGRDVLGNGGTAADAAVAMYFTLAVTLPSRAGLGGGGACVVFDGQEKIGRAIEFLPRASPSGGVVPSGARAMALLHARYGALRWQRLLAPAETMARFGHAVSRAFAKDIATASPDTFAEPELRRLFSRRGGGLARTGDRIRQIELSTVLSGLRQNGVAFFHGGQFARSFAEASSSSGAPLTAADLRGALVELSEAIRVPAGDDDAYFAPLRGGGVSAAQVWRMLTKIRSYAGTSADERPHLFAEAARRGQSAGTKSLGGTSQSPLSEAVSEDHLAQLMADYDAERHDRSGVSAPATSRVAEPAPGAGFVVGDRWNGVVACSLTMNRLFGAGRVAAGTGILLAQPPGATGDAQEAESGGLAAVIVGNRHTGEVRFAGTGPSGASGAMALAQVMLEVLARGQPLEAAIAAPRVHHGGLPDVLLHEAGLAAVQRDGLRRRGQTLRQVESLGRVNAFRCLSGLQGQGEACTVASDPRGSGLAEIAR